MYASVTASSEGVPCPAGFYCPGGASDKQPCAAGKHLACFQEFPGMVCRNYEETDCEECLVGTYTANVGSAFCEWCSASPGRYCPTGSTTSTGVECPVGYFCMGGISDKVSCSVEAGSYCPPGTRDFPGTLCPRGYYCKGGSNDKTACAAGTYSADEGSTSVATCSDCNAGSFAPGGSSTCFKCGPGTVSSALGATTCVNCEPGLFAASSGTVSCTMCPAGETSAAGSISQNDCVSDTSSQSETRVELEVVLPYGREAFTAAVQDKFKIGVATSASVGCECPITKTEVTILNIMENVPSPGARRRLHAASLTVSVSILVPGEDSGDMLVQSHFLSKESINNELAKLGVEQITDVTSSPILRVLSSSASGVTGALGNSGEEGIRNSVGPEMIAGIVSGVAVLLVVIAVVVFRGLRYNKVVAADASEQVDSDYAELKEILQTCCSELNVAFSTPNDDCDLQSVSTPDSSSSHRNSAHDNQSSSKFNIRQLVFGLATVASEGLMSLLCVEESEVYGELSRGVAALDEEIEKNGTAEDKECYNYVKNEEAGSGSKTFQHGWKRDCDRKTGDILLERQIDDPGAPGGKRGMKLDDFVNHEMAKKCKLTKPEVLALRFYTTAGFRTINNPLRDMDRLKNRKAHPLPIMVWLLSSAVKKMRTAFADSAAAKTNFDLYRGMDNVELEADFVQKGGTELSPMSTTEDLKIAIQYASKGTCSVLLRIRTSGFMTLGAQLMWLSAFPFEVEYLYPPATFLKPLRAAPRVFKIGTATFHVVDVQPQMP